MEQKQITVKFENSPKIYEFSPANFDVKIGDFVVVESARGLELAKVVSNAVTINSDAELKKIIRKATEIDKKNAGENKNKALSYLEKTKKHIKKLNLNMKLIGAELTLDGTKIIISFTADGRVDFRELVKNLAGEFRMKIELRQVGARDAVQIMGSCGMCGRPCCCHRYSGDFEHVSIKMAKVQGLSLSPNNISGVCGKLLCCLAYENKEYVDNFNKMPKINSEVFTPAGKGIAVYNNLLKTTVEVKIAGEIKEFKLSEIKVKEPNKSNG